MPEAPPPLPNSEPGWKTYIPAVAVLFPGLVVWLFTSSFILPKLEWVWNRVGLGGTKLQWLLELTRITTNHMQFVVWGIFLLCLLFELRWTRWPHYRRTAVVAGVAVINTMLLVALTAIATTMAVAIPLLTRK